MRCPPLSPTVELIPQRERANPVNIHDLPAETISEPLGPAAGTPPASGARRPRSRPAAAEPSGKMTVRRRPSPRTVLAIASLGGVIASAVSAAAAGLGPSLGGLLVTAANWRLVFLVNVPVGVAAVLLARRRLAESRAPGRRRIPDLPGTLLFALAIGTLVLGVVKGQEWGWGSGRLIGCLAMALAFGAVVIWRGRRHRSPVLDLSLLRIRTVSVANAMMVI